MAQGTIKKLVTEKGFGFISPDSGVFRISGGGIETLAAAYPGIIAGLKDSGGDADDDECVAQPGIADDQALVRINRGCGKCTQRFCVVDQTANKMIGSVGQPQALGIVVVSKYKIAIGIGYGATDPIDCESSSVARSLARA